MGNNTTRETHNLDGATHVILDNEYTITHIPKAQSETATRSEFSDGTLHLEVLKPLELLFLDPFSSDGEETIELDMRVTLNGSDIKNNVDNVSKICKNP
jgi:hypothetical protein